VVEVVALAGALADAREHRQAAVLLGDVVDEFHHVDRLADAGAAEQADLAALGERADEVDDLDAGFEQFHRRREFVELRRFLVDGAAFLGGDGAHVVDGATEHVHDAAKGGLTDGHRNRAAGVGDLHAAPQAVGGAERDGAHDAVAKFLLHFEGQPFLCEGVGGILQPEGVLHLGHVFARELDVHHRADALNDRTVTHRFSF